MWDCLTASLCAIMHDNLPLELLNKPFHIAPETTTFADPAAAARDSSSSPVWMDNAKPSSEVRDAVNANGGTSVTVGRARQFVVARVDARGYGYRIWCYMPYERAGIVLLRFFFFLAWGWLGCDTFRANEACEFCLYRVSVTGGCGGASSCVTHGAPRR